MKNLRSEVRNKAVEIANALKKDGYNDQRAISIATSQAEDWFRNHRSTNKSPFKKKQNK
ncbi:hypothetical protein [Liquorilactobacillus oeni]|uniref:Uncharacterized protein n=1 Tax=Liquorilactobacillus oeni DSM 19972 TaxID=1423777 RepID=A0A0R1MHV1_9LACO|nr:hypothetical protein [Liquorilactobacillus oeni]KRL03947.1 hypothetical protein FD46_GL000114 [Liquorilactobacillus oeni DSM 19972]